MNCIFFITALSTVTEGPCSALHKWWCLTPGTLSTQLLFVCLLVFSPTAFKFFAPIHVLGMFFFLQSKCILYPNEGVFVFLFKKKRKDATEWYIFICSQNPDRQADGQRMKIRDRERKNEKVISRFSFDFLSHLIQQFEHDPIHNTIQAYKHNEWTTKQQNKKTRRKNYSQFISMEMGVDWWCDVIVAVTAAAAHESLFCLVNHYAAVIFIICFNDDKCEQNMKHDMVWNSGSMPCMHARTSQHIEE